MSKVSWIRVDVDIYKNEKVRCLERRVRVGTGLLWIYLLLLAGKSNAGGRLMLSQSTPYTVESMAAELEVEERWLAQAIEEMMRLDMVRRRGRVYSIRDWENHQNVEKLAAIRERERLRKREYRAKKKAEKEQADEEL